jgi:peptide/nickel transport system substrate-binding protein
VIPTLYNIQSFRHGLGRLGLICLLLTALALPGCGGGDGDTQPARETTDELVIALQSDGATLDPHKAVRASSIRLGENIYSTLMRYTPEYGRVQPDLLESYNANEQFTQWTLVLLPELRFHSGRAMIADDVVYSLNRLQEIRGGQAAALVHLESIEAVDGRTVKLTFSKPMAPLMTYLAHPMYAIVDQRVVERHDGNIDNVDAGSGPFKLVEWQRDQHVILEKYENYHMDRFPLLERIVYKPIPDEAARSVALSTGEVDLILDVPIQEIENLEEQAGVNVASVPGTFWEYLGMNCEAAPFDDVRVRQAVAWAIDRAALNKVIKNERAVVLDGGHLPPHHWAHAELKTYPQPNVAKAKQLLAEAGYPDGVDVTLIAGSDFAYQVRAGEVLKQMLAPAGFRVELQQLESTQFFARLNESEFQMTVVGWVGFVDPDQWVWNIFRTGGVFNQQQYANEQVDALMLDGRAVRDREKRKPIYAELLKIIAEEAPMAFLYCNDQTSAMRDDVNGFVVHPTGSTIFLRETFIGEPPGPAADGE